MPEAGKENNWGPFVITAPLEPACSVLLLEIGFESMSEAGKENNRGIESKIMW